MIALRTWLTCSTSALAVVLTACSPDSPTTAGAGQTPTSAPTTASPSTSVDQPAAVDVGGRSLWLSCTGSGDTTVVLDAGLGGDLRTWGSVQPMVARTSRVCSYDRAGIGDSDPAPTPRTAGDAVADLHALLLAAHIRPPYVLVGFSFGGLVSQLYASTYPEETAGLVLVESNHPREIATFERHLTPAQIREDRAAVLANPEGMDPYRSAGELREAGALPHVPLVVVSAGVSEGWPPGWDGRLFDRLWAGLQKDLARSVPGGRQIIAEHSRHAVPQEAPNVVAEAIVTVTDEVRGGS
jgi:pimeloyl-ACP methyl ester carboxylesterase